MGAAVLLSRRWGRTMYVRLLRVLTSLLLASCSSTGVRLPHDTPHLQGTVTRVRLVQGTLRVLVESQPGAAAGDRTELTVMQSTRVLQGRAGEAVQRASSRDLRTGTFIHVWHTGTVLESDPAQAVARTILIVPPEAQPCGAAAPCPVSGTGRTTA